MNNLDSLLENFTQETQLFYADKGKKDESFWEELPKQWWLKIAKDSNLQEKMEKHLGIPFFSLFSGSKDKESLKNIIHLRQRYKILTDVKSAEVDVEDRVKKTKGFNNDIDKQNEVIYDEKADVGAKAVGYGSSHWGSTPECFQKMIEECKKIGFEPDNFSLTSYCQYDSGRSTAEIRPSFILTLTKPQNEK